MPFQKKQALFEAWLLDGVFSKEEGGYRVLPIDEAKAMIRELVGKEEYDAAQELAKGLKNRINLTNREVLRSFRVSFPVYLRIVSTAFRKKTTLSDVVKEWIADDITRIVDALRKREVPAGKADFIDAVLGEWANQPVKSSYQRSEYTLSLTLTPDDIPEEIASACQREFLKQVKNECAKIPKVLERYLEYTKTDDADNIVFNPQLFETRLTPRDDSRLLISLTFNNYLELPNMSEAEIWALEDELRKEFGDEAVHELYEVHEGFFTKEGPSFEIELFSGNIGLRGGEVFLNETKVVPYPSAYESFLRRQHIRTDYEDFKTRLLEDYDSNIVRVKADLEVYLKQDQYDRIAEATEQLSDMQRRRKLADFSLDIIAKLLRRKTQVISLRAPEILIVAWEATRPNRFESLLKVKDG